MLSTTALSLPCSVLNHLCTFPLMFTHLSHTPCKEKAMSLMAVDVVQIKHNRVVGKNGTVKPWAK